MKKINFLKCACRAASHVVAQAQRLGLGGGRGEPSRAMAGPVIGGASATTRWPSGAAAAAWPGAHRKRGRRHGTRVGVLLVQVGTERRGGVLVGQRE
jgi:hypothetical protein